MKNTSTPLDTAKATLTAEAAALTHLADTIGDAFMDAVNLIHSITENGGRVIVSGMGKSGHIGKKIAATFASTGTPSFFVHPGEASHGDLGMIGREDCVFAIGHSGESKEFGDIISYCTRFNIPLIALTGRAESTLGKAATSILLNGVTEEACPVGKAPTTSSTASLALSDAVATALMTLRGFTKEDFGKYHPGGKLGAQLLRVEEVMITDFPTVAPDALNTELLKSMAAKNLGAVGVVDTEGKLVGIFTDGDLKRHMDGNFLTKTASDVMSHTPKTISGHALATEGIAKMEEHGITCLFALDDAGKPLGLFRVQECLTAGIL